ncbi:DUF3017 domain-containing protein [Streptomyces spongiicola]
MKTDGARPEAPAETAARNGAGPARRDGGGPARSARTGDRTASNRSADGENRTASNGPASGGGRAGANGPASGGERAAASGGAVDAAGEPEPPSGSRPGSAGDPGGVRERAAGRSRRPPTVTRDTARPEGGGRAAPGDAPAPARQWPLLTVLGLATLGLLIVGADPFEQAFRIGTMLVGSALLTGAALRRMLPSVGMLAVRSRFTDMVTYGVLGTVIVLLALMVQPRPWLEVPFLEEAVRFTVR